MYKRVIVSLSVFGFLIHVSIIKLLWNC